MIEKKSARICVPVCSDHAHQIQSAVTLAAEYGDTVEIRLDCLTNDELYHVQHDHVNILKECVRPIIFTCRPLEQGGRREFSIGRRLRFWVILLEELLRDNSNFADVEYDVAEVLTNAEKYLTPLPWERVICSYHDFLGILDNLEDIYARMAATKARVLKIAVQVDDITDCIPVLRLLNRAHRDGRGMIAIAMGTAGILTRILGPSRGAFLTYGSLDDESATAPGQVTAFALRDQYRIDRITERTEIMGLVGQPITHSISPQIHNAAFAATELDAVYIPFEVRELDEFIRRMVHPRTRELDWNLRGLSVTAPHKTAIMRHLDWIDPSAIEIGAVNTVVIAGDGLYGYNTDAEAAIGPLPGLIDLHGAHVAVLGAGGLARSLLWALRKGGAHVIVFARDVERGTLTARGFGAECRTLRDARFGEFDIVINTTPLGTRGTGEEATPASSSQLRGAKCAYDLVYNPPETRFMREARDAGCQVLGGLQMLVAQAAEQFKLWTDRDAPEQVMLDVAKKALAENGV